MAKKTIDKVDVVGKRVLMRVDFNVPLDENGRITDDWRIREALPSIKSVLDRKGRLILISHLGRPEGKGPEPQFSLKPAADQLGTLLSGTTVSFFPDDCVGQAAAQAVQNLKDGQVLVLDNLRFVAGEKNGDATFAARLAAFGDIYCNEAFGTSHRNDASMYALPKAMSGKPRVAGLLLQRELEFLSDAINNARRPFVAVLGGAKVSDKLGAISNLMGKVDSILIGGAMAYTFLKSLGHEVGSSLVQVGMLDKARRIIDEAAASKTDLLLPKDHVCGKQITRMTPMQVSETSIPQGWMGLDIGPKTTAQYTDVLRGAKTVIWNGPMGVFEVDPFDHGTRQVAEAIAKATAKGATSVIGGGDTAAAVHAFGMDKAFSHVSTGGGASLELLEGKSFDSVALLDGA